MKSKHEERFLSDVSNHKLKVIRNDGVDRHLRFSRPNSSSYYFEIITWSGCLLIKGDCGAWLFSRIEDMFHFFALDKSDWNYVEGSLSINTGYWAEKLLAVDRHGGAKQHSSEIFKAQVKQYFEEWKSEEKPDRMSDEDFEEQCALLWEELESEVMSASEHTETAYQAVSDFSWDGTNELSFRFMDWWERDFTEYTFSFEWNLLAIVWGIEEFRKFEAKSKVSEEAA